MREYTEVQLPEKRTVIEINNIPAFDIADYDLTDQKELMRYFTSIERICRNSRAYKKMINFLREYVDMNKCSFYKNINNIDTYSIKIHIHHSPFTLFDIVTTVYYKRLMNGESISEDMVAKEVMAIHYNMMVGLIPLSETVHEVVHNGFLFIPTTVVYGKYNEFVSMYEKYIEMANPGILKTLSNLEEFSKDYDFKKETKVLDMQMLYLDTTGAYEFPKYTDIVDSLKQAMNEETKEITSTQYYNKEKGEQNEK